MIFRERANPIQNVRVQEMLLGSRKFEEAQAPVPPSIRASDRLFYCLHENCRGKKGFEEWDLFK